MSEHKLPVPLSSADKTLGGLVNEAVNQTLARYAVDAGISAKNMAFLLELVCGSPLFMLVSQAGIDIWHEKVFSDKDHRAFVFSIYSAFVARFSNDDEDWNELHQLIARAGAIRSTEDTSAMPDVMADRLYTVEEITSSLEGNSWLVVLGLIVLYWNSSLVLNNSSRG